MFKKRERRGKALERPDRTVATGGDPSGDGETGEGSLAETLAVINAASEPSSKRAKASTTSGTVSSSLSTGGGVLSASTSSSSSSSSSAPASISSSNPSSGSLIHLGHTVASDRSSGLKLNAADYATRAINDTGDVGRPDKKRGRTVADLPSKDAEGRTLYRGAKHSDREAVMVRVSRQGDALSRGMGIRAGVQLASGQAANARARVHVDHQGGVCKDYKETGFCGYGDNCIYMHDREVHKTGWEVERDWKENERRRILGLPSLEEESRRKAEEERRLKLAGVEVPAERAPRELDAEGLPFTCASCEGDFNLPVRTPCGHYYCEQCAFALHAGPGKCIECGAATTGSFTVAKDLKRAIKARKEAEEGKGAGSE